MFRWARPILPASRADARAKTTSLAARAVVRGAAETVCPAAENTTSHPLGEKRGACRYHQESFVVKKGRAFEPSAFAVQRPSGWPCVRWTYTIRVPSGESAGSAPLGSR